MHACSAGGVSGFGGGGTASGPLPPSLLMGGAAPQYGDVQQQLFHNDLPRPAKGRRLGDFFDAADSGLGLGLGPGAAGAAAAAPAFGGSGGLTLAGSSTLSQVQLQQLQMQMQFQQLQPAQQVTTKRESSSAAVTVGSGGNEGSGGGYGKQQSFAAMRSLEERAAALMRPRAPQAAGMPTAAAGLTDASYQWEQGMGQPRQHYGGQQEPE